MTGSHGLTLNSCSVISLPAPIAAGMPIAKPMATCAKAPLSTMQHPSAIRAQRHADAGLIRALPSALGLAALLASAVPAWRAAGVEPMVALRNE
jgi:hypothetical protein